MKFLETLEKSGTTDIFQFGENDNEVKTYETLQPVDLSVDMQMVVSKIQCTKLHTNCKNVSLQQNIGAVEKANEQYNISENSIIISETTLLVSDSFSSYVAESECQDTSSTSHRRQESSILLE